MSDFILGYGSGPVIVHSRIRLERQFLEFYQTSQIFRTRHYAVVGPNNEPLRTNFKRFRVVFLLTCGIFCIMSGSVEPF